MEFKPKEVYKVESVYKAFYTGGDLEWSNNGEKLFCQCGTSIQILDVNTGKVSSCISEEPTDENSGDPIIAFIQTPDNECLISSHKSGLLKLWNWKEGRLVKHWKSIHKGPVVKLALNKDGSRLATGGSDSSVRFWDLRYHACTNNLSGVQGVVSVLKVYEKENKTLVFGAGDNTTIIAWDIENSKVVMTLVGHYSKVTGLEFDPNDQFIISASRDRVLILWDLKTGKQLKTLPLYECVEDLVLLPEQISIPNEDRKINGGVYVATGGERGVIRFWDALNGIEEFVQSNSRINKATEEGGLSITKLFFNKATSSIAVASKDQNIIIHDLDTFKCNRQFIGFSDEILDMIYVGPKESHLAVATNSEDIKLYNLEDMNCQLLQGHTDLVVSLARSSANPCIFVSGSKDNSIRVWLMANETAHCVCKGARHNNSIGDVALSQTVISFIASVSQDTTIKIWDLPKQLNTDTVINLNVKNTKIAHEKDINCVTISPNDKIIATASLDKTAKLWSVDDLSILGILRGHKRSVWSCCFSPIDQVLLTTSADATLKLWSLTDLSCLKTLEGHDSSVLRGYFLSRGTQLVSAGGDGLIKLWSIKSSECIASFDSHDSKIWAITVSPDESRIVSGGCDSKVVIWRDATEETKLEKIALNQEKALQEQELSNLLQSDEFLQALKLALSLDRPATVLRIVQSVLKKGSTGLSDAVKTLEDNEKHLLLKCVSHWNSNSKNCYPAQVVISFLIDEISSGALKPSPSVIETLIPYTERHFKRLTQVFQDLHFITYMKGVVQPLSKNMDIS